MTQKRYEEIKAVLTDKKWNAAEFAAHAEKLLPELFAGIDKCQFEAEPEPAVIEPIPQPEPVEAIEEPAEPVAVESEPAVEPSEPDNEE